MYLNLPTCALIKFKNTASKLRDPMLGKYSIIGKQHKDTRKILILDVNLISTKRHVSPVPQLTHCEGICAMIRNLEPQPF